MSLKCSVLGHSFGDTDVTREREEQGSEVVITITETETCERCGETRVVSENKEVTTLETPSDIVGEELDEGETDDAGSESGGTESQGGRTPTVDDDAATTPTTDDAEFVDEAEPAGGGAGDQGSGPNTPPGGSRDKGKEDLDDVDDRQPAAGTEPEGEEDDAVILEDDEETERSPGQWPQETDEEDGDDWAPEMNAGELRPVEEEQPDIEPTGEAATVPEGEFYCPECGFTTPVESSSLREGDFCPECHRGALAHSTEE